jgi:hypothetical protein
MLADSISILKVTDSSSKMTDPSLFSMIERRFSFIPLNLLHRQFFHSLVRRVP